MKKLFVLDAFNLIYRNFFAVPMMHTKSGSPVNATYGMTKLLIYLLQEEKPDGIVVAYDGSGPTIRSTTYEAYKGTRDRMPDELRSQLSYIEELFRSLRIPTLLIEGHEADDIMASIAHQYASVDYQVSLLSGDKDLYQVISENVRIVDGMKKLVAGEKECVEKFGIGSKYVADYLAIVGDSSDNIPGIRGFGPKKAVDLITRFGHLSDIYLHITELPEKVQEVLIAEKANAFLSLDLATVITDLEVEFPLEDAYLGSSDRLFSPEFLAFLSRMEFKSLLKQFGGNNTPLNATQDPAGIGSVVFAPFPPAHMIMNNDMYRDSLKHMSTSRQIFITYEVLPSHMIISYSNEVQSYTLSSLTISPHELQKTIYIWMSHPSIDLISDNLKGLLRSLEIFGLGVNSGVAEEIFSLD